MAEDGADIDLGPDARATLERFRAMTDALRVINALREATKALALIRRDSDSPAAREAADQAILRIKAELEGEE